MATIVSYFPPLSISGRKPPTVISDSMKSVPSPKPTLSTTSTASTGSLSHKPIKAAKRIKQKRKTSSDLSRYIPVPLDASSNTNFNVLNFEHDDIKALDRIQEYFTKPNSTGAHKLFAQALIFRLVRMPSTLRWKVISLFDDYVENHRHSNRARDSAMYYFDQLEAENKINPSLKQNLMGWNKTYDRSNYQANDNTRIRFADPLVFK